MQKKENKLLRSFQFWVIRLLHFRHHARTSINCRRSFVGVHHKVGGSHISRMLWSLIDIHTDPLSSHTGYDFTSYFGLRLSRKTCRKCHLRWLRVKFLQNFWSEDHNILHSYLGQSASQICRISVTCCFRSAAKCNSLLHKCELTGPAGKD